MILPLAIASLVAALSSGQHRDLSRFAGSADIQFLSCSCVTTGAALSEDLPTAGFVNRFHVVVSLPPHREACFWTDATERVGPIPVRSQATPQGQMLIEAEGWFVLLVLPGDPADQAAIAAAAPGGETRMQTITVTPRKGYGGGVRLDILLEEPSQ
jgi:hypothetical protein